MFFTVRSRQEERNVMPVVVFPIRNSDGGLQMAIRKLILTAAVGASVLALSALNASAAIVCSGNVCWHTQERYDYPTDARVIVHPDDGDGVRVNATLGVNTRVAAIGAMIVG
jgi:hypothetical protein